MRLNQGHLKGAKLFADRFDLITSLAGQGPFTQVCEVGVAKGTFSNHLIALLNPEVFIAIDVFEMHKASEFWGKTANEHFFGRTHREFYEIAIERVAAAKSTKVEIKEGLSWDCLSSIPENSLDLIYLDADHAYHAIKRDIAAAKNAIRPGGVIVFNDYTTYDPIAEQEYGVVAAANEFIVENNCSVLGFALQSQMFCDLAIQVSK